MIYTIIMSIYTTRDGSSLVINGIWHIFGGDVGKTFLSDVEAYDPKGILNVTGFCKKEMFNKY